MCQIESSQGANDTSATAVQRFEHWKHTIQVKDIVVIYGAFRRRVDFQAVQLLIIALSHKLSHPERSRLQVPILPHDIQRKVLEAGWWAKGRQIAPRIPWKSAAGHSPS